MQKRQNTVLFGTSRFVAYNTPIYLFFFIDHMCFHGDCVKFSFYFLICFIFFKNQSVAYELGFRNTLSSGFAEVSYEYCSRETNVMAHELRKLLVEPHELAKFTFQSSSSYLG
jgi:hypothetical protein